MSCDIKCREIYKVYPMYSRRNMRFVNLEVNSARAQFYNVNEPLLISVLFYNIGKAFAEK